MHRFGLVLSENGVAVDCGSFEDRLFIASGGSIDVAVKIIQQAVIYATDEKRRCLDTSLLNAATARISNATDGVLEAFTLPEKDLGHFASKPPDEMEVAPRQPGLDALLAQRS